MRSRTDLLRHLALAAEEGGLLLAPELSSDDVDLITADKPWFLDQLRHRLLDEAGFYVSLPEVIEREIRAAHSVTIGLEVTAPTRYSAPARVHARTRIGPHPWSTYRALHPGVKASSAPRIRALGIYIEGIGPLCFEWDLLSRRESTRLLSALMSSKLLIGHNLGEQLSWIFGETEERPTFFADTMLLVQHVKPTLLLQPFAISASLNKERSERAAALIHSRRGKVETTLDYMFACLGSDAPYQECLNRESWSLSRLSACHRRSLEQRLESTRAVLSHLGVPACALTAECIEQKAPTYRAFMTATLRLAEAHVRGVPFNASQSQRMRRELEIRIERQNNKGQERTAAAVSDERNTTILRKLELASKNDGRLHSMVTFAAVTGRTTSHSPGLQNLPSDPEWRSMIRARPNHQILSVDYSTIELRVAAALAARATYDLAGRTSDVSERSHFLRFVSLGQKTSVTYRWPTTTSANTGKYSYQKALTLAASQRVLRDGQQTMMSAIQQGIDLHLLTALDFANRQGKLKFSGRALDKLILMDPEERADLKQRLANERQAAKACNFGLLYGMQPAGLHRSGIDSYGLAWSLEEAESAYDAWFELYPEIALWQLWTRKCQSRALPPGKVKLWNQFRGDLYMPAFPAEITSSSTMSGRSVVALNAVRQALSYQGQGTGADIIALAISDLPSGIANLLLVPVHDELLFEVPSTELPSVKQIVREVMIAAATSVLGGGIPIPLECVWGETW